MPVCLRACLLDCACVLVCMHADTYIRIYSHACLPSFHPRGERRRQESSMLLLPHMLPFPSCTKDTQTLSLKAREGQLNLYSVFNPVLLPRFAYIRKTTRRCKHARS